MCKGLVYCHLMNLTKKFGQGPFISFDQNYLPTISLICPQCGHQGCGKTFSTIYNLNIHTKLHQQVEYIVCEVKGCGEVFPSKIKLEIHQRKHFEDKQIK